MDDGYKKIIVGTLASIVGSIFLRMMATNAGMLSVAGFMPHKMCLYGAPILIWVDAAADSAIFVSYMVIPFLLVKAFRHGIVIQPDDKDKIKQAAPLLIWFAAFILFCGLTHIMGTVTLWYPYYYIDCAFRVCTGIASIGTCIVLSRQLPVLMGMVGMSDLLAQFQAMKEHMARLEQSTAIIANTSQNLEDSRKV